MNHEYEAICLDTANSVTIGYLETLTANRKTIKQYNCNSEEKCEYCYTCKFSSCSSAGRDAFEPQIKRIENQYTFERGI